MCNCNKVNFELNTEYKYKKSVYDNILQDMSLRVDTYNKRKLFLANFNKTCIKHDTYLGMNNTIHLNEEIKLIDNELNNIKKSLIPIKNKASLNKKSYKKINSNKGFFRDYISKYDVLTYPDSIACYSTMNIKHYA